MHFLHFKKKATVTNFAIDLITEFGETTFSTHSLKIYLLCPCQFPLLLQSFNLYPLPGSFGIQRAKSSFQNKR